MNNKQKELHSITIDLDKFATLLEDHITQRYTYCLNTRNVSVKANNNHIIINLDWNETNYLINLFQSVLGVKVKFEEHIMNDKFCFDLNLTEYLNDTNIYKRLNTFVNLLDETDNFLNCKTILKEFAKKYDLLSNYISTYINENYTYIRGFCAPSMNSTYYIDYHAYNMLKEDILTNYLFDTVCLFIDAQQNGIPISISIQQNRRKIYKDIIKLLDLDYSYLDNVNYRTANFKFRIPYNKLDVIIGLLKLSI